VVVEIIPVGQRQDLRSRGVHYLAWPRGQAPFVGSLGIGLLHDMPGRVADGDPLGTHEGVETAKHPALVALLGLALACPVPGDVDSRTDDAVGDVYRRGGHWRAPGRIKAVLPRSLNCTRGEARCTT
jgi:hypothetical protein